MTDRLRDPIWTAERLGLKPDTLRDWRLKGRGPTYIKVGHRIRYRDSDVERWISERTVNPGSAS